MAALLRRPRKVDVIEVTLGSDSLALVAARVLESLRDPRTRVVVNVSAFDHFDQDELVALHDLATWSPRVVVQGLDSYVDRVLPTATSVDVRSSAERALTYLSAVVVVTATLDGHPLDDHEMDTALQLAIEAQRGIVTVDLRNLDRLSPAQLLTLTEASGQLERRGDTFILVNATAVVTQQLRGAGLSASASLGLDDI